MHQADGQGQSLIRSLPPNFASKCRRCGHGQSPLSPSWKHAAYGDALPGSCKEPQATLAHFTFFMASPLQPSPYENVLGSCLGSPNSDRVTEESSQEEVTMPPAGPGGWQLREPPRDSQGA